MSPTGFSSSTPTQSPSPSSGTGPQYRTVCRLIDEFVVVDVYLCRDTYLYSMMDVKKPDGKKPPPAPGPFLSRRTRAGVHALIWLTDWQAG